VLVLLTHLSFPVQWTGIVGDGQLAAVTLLARNLLLVSLTVWLLLSVRGGAARDEPNGSLDQNDPRAVDGAARLT
jgi:hypothetical protein